MSSILDNISVVMVETSHPGNIGAAARAMKTMGLSKLVLVNSAAYPSQKAIWRSAGASDVVEQAQCVDSLEEALKDCSLVFAASARQRRIPWPMLTPEQCAEKALSFAGSSHQVALVFGREDRGLHNEELQLSHYHVEIPANPVYPVLNVAASVQVLCYELYKQFSALSEDEEEERGGTLPCAMANWDESFASLEDVERFYRHLEKVLVDIDFHDPANPRQLMTRLRRLFNRSHLDMMELNILRGILSAVEKASGKDD